MTDVDTNDDRATDETVLRKVRKLLDKARGTSNDHEAEAFERKAAELIARHRLDPDRLAATDRGDLALRLIDLGTGPYVRARLDLLCAVAAPHDVKVVFERTPTGTIAYLGGFGPDLDLTEMMYHSLHTQAAARLGSIRKGSAAETRRFRRSFLFGFAARIRQLLEENVERERRAADATERAGSISLALRERSEMVADYLRTELGPVRRARPVAGVTPQGFAAGAEAAGSADLGRPRMAGRPALAQRTVA